MEKTKLYYDLLERLEGYRQLYPKFVERDLKIAKLYAHGDSTQRIATEVIHDVSVVKRVIKRIQHFLSQDCNSDDDILQASCYLSPAIAGGIISSKNIVTLKLYLAFIARHQSGHNDFDDGIILRLHGGLKNSERRAAVLDDLNTLTVRTAETPPRSIKIFEYVTYSKHRYSFELTESAYPYFYPLYFAFGRHPLLSSLLDY